MMFLRRAKKWKVQFSHRASACTRFCQCQLLSRVMIRMLREDDDEGGLADLIDRQVRRERELTLV